MVFPQSVRVLYTSMFFISLQQIRALHVPLAEVPFGESLRLETVLPHASVAPATIKRLFIF